MKAIRHPRQAGFALLENMISVLLLSIGAIGIALSTATTVKINADNLQRSMALNAASTALEELYLAADKDAAGATLHTSIAEYQETDDSAGYIVHVNPDESGVNRDPYIVTVVAAEDAAGTDVLTTGPPYVSPVTIAVRVDYQSTSDLDGDDEYDKKTAKTSFTFLLKS